MKPYSLLLGDELRALLKATKERDGTPESETIRRALRAYGQGGNPLLPEELEFRSSLGLELRADIERAEHLFESVMRRIGDDVSPENPGIRTNTAAPMFVRRMLVAYLTKVISTFRGIVLLANSGRPEEASALLRVLFEVLAVVRFIVQDEAQIQHRAAMVYLHGRVREAVMVRTWQLSPKLRHKDQAAYLAEAKVPDFIEKLVPPEVNREHLKKHWSGQPGGLATICPSLDLGEWYDTVYRTASMFSHATDHHSRLEVDEGGGLVVSFMPHAAGLGLTLKVGCVLLWVATFDILKALGSEIGIDDLKPDVLGAGVG